MQQFTRVRRFIVAAVTVLSAGALPAQDAVARQIMAFEDRWGAASLKRDGAAVEKMLAGDFMYFRPDGSRADKGKTVADVNNDTRQYVSGKNTNYTVRVYGKAAVITGLWTVTSKAEKGNLTRRIRWTDVWIKQDDDRWLCVAGQSAIVDK